MWFFYALSSALIDSAKDVFGKGISSRTNEFLTSFCLTFFAFLFLLPITLIQGIPVLKTSYWESLMGIALLSPLATFLYTRAITLSPLSEVVPLLALTPIFSTIMGAVFEKKIPDIFGITGIVLISLGVYLLRIAPRTSLRHLADPFILIFKDAGSQSMLVVVFIQAVGAYIARINIHGSSLLFFTLTNTGVSAFILLLITVHRKKFILKYLKSHILHFSLLGILNAASELTIGAAVSSGFIPYVISIKRTNIVWSFLLGNRVYKEAVSFSKIMGLFFIIIGLLCILLPWHLYFSR